MQIFTIIEHEANSNYERHHTAPAKACLFSARRDAKYISQTLRCLSIVDKSRLMTKDELAAAHLIVFDFCSLLTEQHVEIRHQD